MSSEDFSVFETVDTPTQVLNSSGRPIFVNRAWQDLWAVPDVAVREVVLNKYNILTDPLMYELGIRDYILQAFSGKEVEPFPVPYEPKKFGHPGRSRWVLAKLSPVLDDRGSLQRLIVSFRDLTPDREDVWSDDVSNEFETHIEISEKGAVIRGTTIRPLTIFRLLKIDSESIDDVRRRFPTLSLEQIEVAISYCQSLSSDSD